MLLTTVFLVTFLIVSLAASASISPLSLETELTTNIVATEDPNLFATGDVHYVKPESAAEEKQYNLSAFYDLDALREFYEQSPGDNVVSRIARRLVGSNCILMEEGTVTPYYVCIGCRVEEAMGCIDDMRLNRTGNVRHGCKINSMHESLDNQCCPTVAGYNRLNYIGMSYPEGLRCLERAGCRDSIFYHDVLAECRRTCNFNIPRTDRSICFAGYQGMYLTNLRKSSSTKEKVKTLLKDPHFASLWTVLHFFLSLFLIW
jgi:hypothetical protein